MRDIMLCAVNFMTEHVANMSFLCEVRNPHDTLVAEDLCKDQFTESESDQRKNYRHQRKFSLSLPLSLSVNGP